MLWRGFMQSCPDGLEKSGQGSPDAPDSLTAFMYDGMRPRADARAGSEAFEDIFLRPHRFVDATDARRLRQPIQGALVGNNVRLVRIELRKLRLPRLDGLHNLFFRQARVALLLKAVGPAEHAA